ncbi:MAG TPA: RNA pyrophosphohydrolase [Sphingomicrobium sp.]|jgi:putative (di)nucleoside polyphosphate hydrolase|nr:RNA pyrophosphohydrolase [Sphingomicrobium sp.]
MAVEDRPYRHGVGVMLLNRHGKVFVGARIDNPEDAWQMPQGGIDEGENDPWLTALRELEEETGIAPRLVQRIAECPERLRYELPEEWRPRLWGGKWVGQEQDWFLARFLGTDDDVNIATEHPEFREWKWVEPARLPELIVPFKRELYRRLITEFTPYL